MYLGERMIDVDAYPLTWPDGWKRTPPHRRTPSRYQVRFAKARDDLIHELKLLGAREIIVSSNVPLRGDGLPYASHAEPDDPGVAVYWRQNKGEERVIACDSWSTVRDNLRAVGLAIQAIRSIDRTGASEILDRAFRGFNMLPKEGSWRNELGLPNPFTREHVDDNYRRLAQIHHPDRGGSVDKMVRLNRARDEALRFLGQ